MAIQIPKDIENQLALALENNLVDFADSLIKKHNLPYTIFLDKEGKSKVRSSYKQGELYLNKFITVHDQTIRLKEDAIKAAKTAHELLVIGDTGTGKELIAKSQIWDREGAIKAVNCAGFPSELLESELFGYVRGAFTGANNQRDGLITSAENGLMFFDEIGEMSLVMQAKLLRVLQEKSLRKVGGNVEEKVNCKFVFATHRNLEEMIEQGLFRKDLYARLSTLTLRIKSLWPDRKCDIEPITKSIDGGEEFFGRYGDDLLKGVLPLSLNVRSIQQYVIRYNVFGRLTNE